MKRRPFVSMPMSTPPVLSCVGPAPAKRYRPVACAFSAGNWWYAAGQKSGGRNIGKLPAGEYQVRVYFDWPQGGYTVQSRLPFAVR
jgi:hypothetical protein